ncbi:MAG: hypothetical protein AAF527_13570 [Pseudomonadota bacterium]
MLKHLLVACGVFSFACGDPASADAPEGWDGQKLLALVDADMAATGNADGKLHPIADTSDQLMVIDMATGAAAPLDRPVSNTVMGWPGSLAIGTEARFAYTVTSRSGVSRSIEEMADGVFKEFPIDTTLTTIDVETARVVSETSVCCKPMSVDVAPGGDWLLIACGDKDGELTIVPLEGGVPGAPRSIDLDVPAFAERDADEGATYGVVHPGGRAAAVVLNNRAVALVRLDLDATGTPTAGQAEAPTPTDRWLSVARWTQTGDHLLVADTGWGPSPLDAVFNANGDIVSFALSPSDDARGIVSVAEVSKSPEAFELNRTGDLLVAVNMERTYLPNGFPGALFRHRNASSLSLVEVDARSGALKALGEPVKFRGVLPEDAVFDADGDRIAAIVYQDHGRPRSDGWVTFFRIEGRGDARRVIETGERVALPRGGHDLVPVD